MPKILSKLLKSNPTKQKTIEENSKKNRTIYFERSNLENNNEKETFRDIRQISKESLSNQGVLTKNNPAEVMSLFNVTAITDSTLEEKTDAVTKLTQLANIINIATVVARDKFAATNHHDNTRPSKEHLIGALLNIGISKYHAPDIINICIHEGKLEKNGLFGLGNNLRTRSAQILYDNIKHQINILKGKNKDTPPENIISHLKIQDYYSKIATIGNSTRNIIKHNNTDSHDVNMVATLRQINDISNLDSYYYAYKKDNDNSNTDFKKQVYKDSYPINLGKIAYGEEITTPDKLAEFAHTHEITTTQDLAKFIQQTKLENIEEFVTCYNSKFTNNLSNTSEVRYCNININDLKNELRNQQINYLMQQLNPKTTVLFKMLLDIPSVRVGEATDETRNFAYKPPIVLGSSDGDHCRLILAGIQTGKMTLSTNGLNALAKIMNFESDIINDIHKAKSDDDEIIGLFKYQTNPDLNNAMLNLEKNITYLKSDTPLICMGNRVTNRFNINNQIEQEIRNKLKNANPDNVVYIHNKDDSYAEKSVQEDIIKYQKKFTENNSSNVQIVNNLTQEEKERFHSLLQRGLFASSVNVRELESHDKETFAKKAYYHKASKTLYINDGLLQQKDNESSFESAYGEIKATSPDEFVEQLNTKEYNPNNATKFKTLAQDKNNQPIGWLKEVTIVRGNFDSHNINSFDKQHELNITSRIKTQNQNGSILQYGVVAAQIDSYQTQTIKPELEQ